MPYAWSADSICCWPKRCASLRCSPAYGRRQWPPCAKPCSLRAAEAAGVTAEPRSGRRLAALLGGVVALLAAACGPAAAFIAWLVAKLDAEPSGRQLWWLSLTLVAGLGLVIAGALLLRFYVRSGKRVDAGVVSAPAPPTGHGG